MDQDLLGRIVGTSSAGVHRPLGWLSALGLACRWVCACGATPVSATLPKGFRDAFPRGIRSWCRPPWRCGGVAGEVISSRLAAASCVGRPQPGVRRTACAMHATARILRGLSVGDISGGCSCRTRCFGASSLSVTTTFPGRVPNPTETRSSSCRIPRDLSRCCRAGRAARRHLTREASRSVWRPSTRWKLISRKHIRS